MFKIEELLLILGLTKNCIKDAVTEIDTLDDKNGEVILSKWPKKDQKRYYELNTKRQLAISIAQKISIGGHDGRYTTDTRTNRAHSSSR